MNLSGDLNDAYGIITIPKGVTFRFYADPPYITPYMKKYGRVVIETCPMGEPWALTYSVPTSGTRRFISGPYTGDVIIGRKYIASEEIKIQGYLD